MKIYLVGGAVRDTLLNYPVYDKDWVVVGASAEEMLAQGYQAVGQDFPVFIHPESGEEYALARTERKSGKGYTGFQYFADKAVTLEEDLLRRDLTINAMAMDEDKTIYDPYNGQSDLNNRVLRHVSPAFAEDPLRVLRVARFAARYHHLGFTIADETLELMHQLSSGDELEHLTAERMWKEFERSLGEQSPEVFLSVLNSVGAITKVLPELTQSLKSETLLPLFSQLCQQNNDPEVRFACLLSLCGDLDIPALCNRLRTPNAYKELATQCQQHHKTLSAFNQSDAETKLNALIKLDLIRRPQRLAKILLCVEALHPDSKFDSIHPILDSISQIQPKKLIAEGYTGASLGEAIQQRRLQICSDFSPEA
ncbi:hypothetical protein [uncultured Neptuniibacter sp.]|uniref:hypothetical protein n=1 Tax=uncultured Neptuniibacter sp. TaxID=502143 RepID=UPI00261D353B|nr:hypothetical protein [uncultured Neptuniibacter sp.]